eukprot:1179381-Prorocentrum_minimum.AAC.4
MQVGNAEITYMFSVVSFVAFWLFLYGVNLTAPGDSFINWSYLYNAFAFIDPYLLSGLGVAMAIGLSVLGAACMFALLGTEHEQGLAKAEGSHS